MEQGDLFHQQKSMSRQCHNILSRLRRGPVTNTELIERFCYRYGARLHELRHDHGEQIDKRQLERGVWEYELAR